MRSKVLALLLLSAAIIVPAAVPASQPADIRLDTLAAAHAITIAPVDFLALLGDPNRTAEFSIELVDGYSTLEWINQDPFAL
jgi:hypothetical protein